MYLMDSIIETASEVHKRKMYKHPVLSIFPTMESKLNGCPRYLFDEAAIHTAVELTLGRPKVLKEAMDHLRIPYSKIWIEWPESGRKKLRETFGPNEAGTDDPRRPLPNRLGFLLESDETGRKGMATWVWNNNVIKDYNAPNIAPISPFFDLDAEYPQDNYIVRNFLAANLAQLWIDKPIQLEALQKIWRTSQHGPSDWGYEFLNNELGSYLYGKDQRISHFYADVYGEYIMIWAVMMLLTSSKKIVEYEKIDNTKWNKARAKQGKAPKLDHTVVTMYVGSETVIHQQGMPLGYTRKSPRIHMVSSYLNRRGDKHWIVQPFWRGKGEIISRHVKVKGV